MLTRCDVSSLVVDRLCDQAREQHTAVTCFYFDFAARKEQSATSMLGSLLKQIVGGLEKIPEEILQVFQGQKMAIGGRGPSLPDIVKMLQTVTSSLRTFVCIDALDECAVVHRVRLLNSLKQILEKSPRTRIFIIGRSHIRDEVEKHLPGQVMSVSVGSNKDDIIGYLRVKLDEDESPEAMDENLAADILEKIPDKMSDMYVGAMTLESCTTQSADLYAFRFLLVSLNIEAILHESTIHRRREKLSKMTNGLGLGDVYDATIERIKAQAGDKPRLGMAALMWISHAERPLQVDELCYALAVELGSPNFNTGNVPSISILVSCCQGLITVDKEASTVRLIHFTLQEYLSAHPDLFGRPHSAMAEICLTYLNSQQVKSLSTTPSPAGNTPFLEYCSVFWGIHAKKEFSGRGRSLALELLKEDYGQISTKLLLAQVTQVKNLDIGHLNTWSPFSGLHCASFFGIIEVVASLIEGECYNINEEDILGCTPLVWAACNGHEEVVKMLLRQEEVDPNRPDEDGWTPLSFAAWSGHEGVVQILLRREEVTPDKPDNYGWTPLSCAAQGGHEGVVRILLEREEVNPDKPDNYGQTPLSSAAWSGHEGVVKILLGRKEVNPDKPDNRGQTPLSAAARNGHEGVVKMLLGREEVNPDEPDRRGRTPLRYAALNGHKVVMQVLLGRQDINPGKPDNRGRTPLSLAAGGGHEGVVKMLLGREEVNPDQPDNHGRTPLLIATINRRKRVVALLQSHNVVTPGIL